MASFDIFGSISEFMERGGPVLVAIMLATFILWALIIERYLYFWLNHKKVVATAEEMWKARSERHSWAAHKVRDRLISEVRLRAGSGLSMIATVIALCPMLGLLGTVTGMIEVFDVMAITGSSNPRAMAGGVSRATIPTMAGMVAALSGMYFNFRLQRRLTAEVHRVADRLPLLD